MIRRFLLGADYCCRFAAGAAVRIKDIVSIQGVRANQIVGYGLVIGLNGTGDTLRNAPFTDQSLQSMLDHMGINVRNAKARTRNVAGRDCYRRLACVRRQRLAHRCHSELDGRCHLAAGRLADHDAAHGRRRPVYAVAQGPLAVTGFSTTGKAETVTQGVPTTGRIPNGGIVERDAPGKLADETVIVLELRNPDFITAVSIADAINGYMQQRYGIKVAKENDLRTVSMARPFFLDAGPFHRRDR